MSEKRPSRPVWWKNTFFVFGFLMLLVAIFGLIRGEDSIRDPGQKFENGLVWFYVLGTAIMLLNGYLTHRQAMQAYEEEAETAPKETPKASTPTETESES